MVGLFRSLSSQSVTRLLVFSFLLVSLVPLGFLSFELYQAAWKNAQREVQEKHRLLAMNLASPIHGFVKDHEMMLAALADRMAAQPRGRTSASLNREILESAFRYLKGFQSLAIVNLKGEVTAFAHRAVDSVPSRDIYSSETCFVQTRDSRQPALSSIKPSPVTGKPTIVLSQPLRDSHDGVSGVLMGELLIDRIESLRAQIRFGKRGHSAIVDNTGRVIAHPNPEWAREMRDLSSWPIVQQMMAGKTGVTEFYSPFIKANMVAGYASVPEIGWGIMVPQPKPEIEEQINSLLMSHLRWGVLGFVVAMCLALMLAHWIIRPLKHLADRAARLGDDDSTDELLTLDRNSPREISILTSSIINMVERLRSSRKELDRLNQTLQHRIDEATEKLVRANTQLDQLSKQDHLTSIANRRHFEESLGNILDRRSTDNPAASVMLIDVDYFKSINDKYGHAAGDTVLTQLADLLQENMRQDDIVARYGGDEFAVLMRCAPKVASERAEAIRSSVSKQGFSWNEKDIHTTVSIGLLHIYNTRNCDVEAILHSVDLALYDAKRAGRNVVVEARVNPPGTGDIS